MRMPLLLSLAVALAAIPAGSASAQTAHRKTSAQTPVVVKMSGDNLTFDPPTVTIRRGQTVEWQNNSHGLIHTVTDDTKQAQNKADVSLPPGAKPFDSGYMKPGDSFKHTFTTRGTYRYVCITHEPQKMVGEVVVK